MRAGEDRFSRARPPLSRGAWSRIVGPRIAERSEPVALESGVLVVRVASHAWASELGFVAEDIVARLRATKFAVKTLQFRVGAVDPPRRPPERTTSRRVPAPLPIPDEIKASLAKVEDEELRRAIEDSCSRQLAWRALAEEDRKVPPRQPKAAELPQRSDASRSNPSKR